jgi:hypothetical protein
MISSRLIKRLRRRGGIDQQRRDRKPTSVYASHNRMKMEGSFFFWSSNFKVG